MKALEQTQLGDYTILRDLGWGSLGHSYLAEHALLKKRYVLKLFREEEAEDSAFMARFEKELAALAHLKHPHLIAIHDAAKIEDHTFTVTELFGPEPYNLGDFLEKRRYELREEEILPMAKQIASGLDALHAQGISHGAFKLSNVLLREGAHGMEVALSDAGLARIVGPLAVFSRGMCALGDALSRNERGDALRRAFCQNLVFLAPEQKWGEEDSCTPQSDVYAFGVLLYFLLVGEFPEGYFDMPSKRLSALKWNWDLFICRCLQTDPARRPLKLVEKMEALVLQPMQERVGAGEYTPKPQLKTPELKRPVFEADPAAPFRIESSVVTYRPERPQPKDGIEPILTDMVVFPKGRYFRGSQMGKRDEMPRHEIAVDAFAIDIHPVTNEQFIRFLEAMGEEKDANGLEMIRLRDARIKRQGGKYSIESGYAKHPVVGVTWYGAVAYAKWVGKRLPWESEWEIAACAGVSDRIFPTGNQIERHQANFFSSDTTPVMSYPPNARGLFDVAGNVYEWCQDWYDYEFYNTSMLEPNNPKGPPQGVYRVLRGGCWKSLKEDLRCAHRHRNNPGIMDGAYGFRCAADAG